MASTPLDHDILEAIDVLAHAVDRLRMPGVLEFRLLSNALRRAIDSRSEQELAEAARVFKTLEPEFRVRILKLAEAEAHMRAGHVLPAVPDAPLPPVPSLPTVKPPRSIGSNFLAALNGLRPSKANSRNAAKDRLILTVENQRGGVDAGGAAAGDRGLDSGLRPGAPLPRSS